MTVDQASEMLYEEANKQGIPLDREFCNRMSRLLLLEPMVLVTTKPGDIARFRRKRYEEWIDSLQFVDDDR
jgi:hypothetical protein